MCLLTLYGCPSNWAESYDYEGDAPHDIYALYELLEARPEGIFLAEDSLALLNDVDETSNYIFVGQYAYYNEKSVTQLLDFVERGNTAFISAYQMPEDLGYHLFGDACFNEYYLDQQAKFPVTYLDTVQLELDDKDYTLYHLWDHNPYNRAAHYIDPSLLCDEAFDNEALGYINQEDINFVRLKWGEGNFYFHTNPIFLTNYYLADSLRHEYAEAAISVLGEGPVYWDEISRVPPAVARQRNNARNAQNQRNYGGGRNLLTGNEALSYIQQQPPLALAWYTLLFTTLLFLILKGRRRQRIIPLISRRENSSKRFIDTMSRLVYQSGNHGALARQELNNLRFHLKDRFGVRWKEGEPPPENLAETIGAPTGIAERALIEIRLVQKKKYLEESDLVRFHRAIEPLFQL
ncbi:MAG: hypothetical protein ACJAZ9_001305 [Neolewinella sp.]|jgi:hypothetical protein